MKKDKKDSSESKEESEEEERHSNNIQAKMPLSFYFSIFLFFACSLILLPMFDGIKATFGKAENLSRAEFMNDLEREEQTLICDNANITQTCPNPNPNPNPNPIPSEIENRTCPEYFRWIYEDLKPWREKGITREAIEAGRKEANVRLLVVEGRVYVETYKPSFQTRDVFTVWGIVQLLRLYPGKIPDLDLMFGTGDFPKINKADYHHDDSLNIIPPLFHYCGNHSSFDIPFPDWSFWGWPEVNIKPWKVVAKEIKKGNKRVKWVDRQPFAYWKGNIRMGRRRALLRCNSTQDWNSIIFLQRWHLEARQGFKQSNLADQCTHRYKIYMEGRTWSVSEKYIQACDSMLLLVTPNYYEFFTRSLLPLRHYWPINPWKLCHSIKFAVDWGNINPEKAQEIGRTGSNFVMEELKMKNIYDYMFHLLSEYGKLLKYKPTVPPEAVEVCLETMGCNAFGREKQYKIESMVKGPSQTGPCTMPPPYTSDQLHKFHTFKNTIIQTVGRWEETGDIHNTID